jgi:preprotein translocase SecE subunit
VKTVEGAQEAGPSGSGGFLAELRRPYKADQGVVTRRIAYWAAVGLVLWGARDLWVWLQGFGTLQSALFPDAIFGGRLDLSRLPLGGPAISGSVLIAVAVGAGAWVWAAWFLKRPWLADLLIETESEMKKVSWPAKEEAWAATKVVTVTVILFTLVLLGFDVVITGAMKLLTGLPL